MMEPRQPKYDWGLRVVARMDLFNDGSFPDKPEGELLVPQSEAGEIVNVGVHEDSGWPVYLVEFAQGMVIGCLEEEIAPAVEVRP